jgi:hypothetical protein
MQTNGYKFSIGVY